LKLGAALAVTARHETNEDDHHNGDYDGEGTVRRDFAENAKEPVGTVVGFRGFEGGGFL